MVVVVVALLGGAGRADTEGAGIAGEVERVLDHVEAEGVLRERAIG